MKRNGRYKFPAEVQNQQVEKKLNSSNTDCGSVTSKNNIKDSNVTTDVTETDDIADAKRLSDYMKKILPNEIPDERIEWPLHLSVKIYFIKIYLWGTCN